VNLVNPTGGKVIKRILAVGFAVVACVGVGERTHANGVAICIAMGINATYLRDTDLEYFLHYDHGPESTGWDARRAARQDHDAEYGRRSRPSCRSSGTAFTDGGRFVVVKGGRTKDALGGPYTRWALGFGATCEDALDDALKVLRRRDRLWVESKHGYSVVEQGTF